jgi:hypothetical protein
MLLFMVALSGAFEMVPRALKQAFAFAGLGCSRGV